MSVLSRLDSFVSNLKIPLLHGLNNFLSNHKITHWIESFFADHKKVLWLATILGVFMFIITMLFATSIYNDATLYANMSYAFSIGDWQRAFVDSAPPLFPVLSGLICKLGVPVYYATLTVGSILFILTIFPLYFFLCCFTDKKYAAWGCLFYILAPKMIRFGCAGLQEGGRNFFVISSLCLIFSFFYNRKIFKLVLLGIALAGFTLIRSEGIAFVPLTLFCVILLVLKKSDYKFNIVFFRNSIVYCLIILAACVATLSPRIYQVHEETGYFETDTRQVGAIKEYIKVFESNKNNNVQPLNITKESKKVKQVSRLDKIFSLSFFGNFINNFSRGTYELYEVLLALGLIILIKRKKWTMEYSLIVLFVLINAGIFYLVSSNAYRYFIINILIFMPFTLIGYREFLRSFSKYNLRYIFLVAVFIVAIFQIINGLQNSLDNSKSFQKNIGYWISKNIKPEEKGDVVTVLAGWYPQFAFFAGANSGIINNIFINKKLSGTDGRLKLTAELINKGFHADELYSSIKLYPNKKIIKPNVIVIAKPRDHIKFIKGLKNFKNLKFINTEWNKDAVIFKVL